MGPALTDRPFRFGVYLTDVTDRVDFVDKCVRAEGYGFDVIGIADHLNMWAPFPSLMVAAEATGRTRIATAMLDTAFYNPTLLARDVATADRLTDGRLELGLGTGYQRSEFDAAGIRWPDARARVDHLEYTITVLRHLFADPDHQPRPVQWPAPPLWLGGRGDRVLALAARYADIIGFTGFAPAADGGKGDLADFDGVAERVAYVRNRLGNRDRLVELNVLVWRTMVTPNRRAKAAEIDGVRGLSADQLLDVPTVLIGTEKQIAEQLIEYRERLGLTYFTVRDCNLDSFGPIIELLK